MKNTSPWPGFRNFKLLFFMYLILAQIHSHIFNLAHRIRIKINISKKEELLFEANMKLYNMRFKKIKIWEGVISHKKVETKYYYLKLYERVLVNNLVNNLYTAKRLSNEFGCLRAKMEKNFYIFTNLRRKKNLVLLLPFFVLLVSVSYYLHHFVSLITKFLSHLNFCL